MSQQPFNINEPIFIKLEKDGLEAYRKYYENLFSGTNYKDYQTVPKKDKFGYSRFQLWEFMQIFGKMMGMGIFHLSEGNNVYFKHPEENQ